MVLYICLAFLCFFSGIESTQAQATFTANATALNLKNALQADGVTITNPIITKGEPGQLGVFSNGKLGASLEVENGVAFTTSSITNAFSTNDRSPNSDSFSVNYFDMDLNRLNTDQTLDVVVFEFDFVAEPNYTGVLLEYQFASDEYPDFVGSIYNDLFGFFVSDPNSLDPNVPDGDLNNNGTYDAGEEPALNLATVPGTTNFVSINNINIGSPGANSSNPPLGDFTQGAFYINNGHEDDDGDSLTRIPANQNTGPKPLHIEFNGATKKLPTQLNLIKGITYHMKIVIADLGDSSYDSGVFISGIAGVPDMVSNDDLGSVTENIGGVAVQNVLINDLRAGNINPSISEVELVQISSSNSGVSLDVNTGAVNVAPGTPLGVYQLEYSLCDPSPDNCSNSFVYITVLSDNDNDGIADIDDLDDDNDGILDLSETCNGFLAQNSSGVWLGTTSSNLTVSLSNSTPNGNPFTTNDGQINYNFDRNGAERKVASSQNIVYTYTFSTPVPANELAFNIGDVDPADFAGQDNTTGYVLTINGAAASFDFTRVKETGATTLKYDIASAKISLNGTTNSNQRIWLKGVSDVLVTTFEITGTNLAGDFISYSLFARSKCDTDNDGLPNSLDTDSDNDGCPDAIEAAGDLTLDKLTILNGGSMGGSSKNLGVNSDANGSPIVSGQGASGYIQNQTTAVTDANQNTACSIDLTITKTVSKPVLKIGQTVVFTLTLKNEGLQPATNVRVKDKLPIGLTYNGGGTVAPTNTTYTPGTGIWDLSTLTIAKNQTIELKIGATVNTLGTIITNNAEISTATEIDIDSTPNSNN
ncbi:DUF11 domain-containing protein [Polaribacter sp. ALD11]|uniref:DUF11 domain-containing protein n=1 Tax=Polaribacter sp. ALD11 TaxID=2058137 RepID=UPI0012FE301B|nr:DUF11 domain-containing protein [Polaribacter sp. ALD11]